MASKIKEKLKEELSKTPKTEKDIVYIMVLIRKILEKKNKKANYSLLNFYCNWALHVKIAELSPAKNILDKITNKHKGGGFGESASKIVDEMLGLKNLLKQIKRFLKEESMPQSLFENEENWFKFRKLFVKVLSYCPLESDSESIEKFEFTQPTRNNTGKNEFRFSFKIKFRDDPTTYEGGYVESLANLAKFVDIT